METTLTVETTSELLRLVLPLMASHKVPVTPKNYAVWYEYVRAENVGLKAAMDKLLETDTSWSDYLHGQLYNDFIEAEESHELEQVRQEMNGILVDVQSSMLEAGQNVGHYSGRLGGYSDQFDASCNYDEIKSLLKTLIQETRAMQESSKELRAHFDQKSAEIASLQVELQRERTRAVTDPLTGLPNRQALMDAMEAAVNNNDTSHPMTLIMLDIDHFKRINDQFGHLIGDRVLRFIASLLQNHIKGMDTAARFGGEEFAVLLPATSITGALAVAENLRQTIASSKLVRSDTKESLGKVTASMGVAVYRTREDFSTYIDRADKALYAAKAAGRNCVKSESDNN